MQTFTRREFYDLVWSKPITKTCGDLGVSDVAVHKICAKHDIPKPPRGHWVKIEHDIEPLGSQYLVGLGQFIGRSVPPSQIERLARLRLRDSGSRVICANVHFLQH